jgi:hypothetical protein
MSPPTLQVFIGSGEASLIERKVLEYSIHKHCGPNVQVHVYNGTHDTIEWADGRCERVNTPLKIKYANVTEFSNFRWFIPRLCQHQGRALYVDSDMICFSDLADLASINMQGAALMAKPSAYEEDALTATWGLSMALMDCALCRFETELWFEEIEQGAFSIQELHRLGSAFQARHPVELISLPDGWNVFDHYDPATCHLIHYTQLGTQPWKFVGHPFGDIWFQYLREAMQAGFITNEMIQRQIMRGYVRVDLLQGNFTRKIDRLALLARNQIKVLLNR